MKLVELYSELNINVHLNVLHNGPRLYIPSNSAEVVSIGSYYRAWGGTNTMY